jgi:hypothetical protein
LLGHPIDALVAGSPTGCARSAGSCTMMPDGALGAFAFSAASAVALIAPRAEFTTAMVGNYLHVIGGIASGNLNTVERTTFGSDPP